MPPITSTSKVVGYCVRHFVRSTRGCSHYRRLDQSLCLTHIAGLHTSTNYHKTIGDRRKDLDVYGGSFCDQIQKRAFLGCGDGEEGGVLSKVYEEKIVLGYSPEQLFDVVAAVDLYHGFVPWCQRSDIVRHYPNGSFDAELEIGFKFFVESYVSHVELSRPNFVKSTVSESSLFEHLINIWEFKPGPVPGSCNLHFLVDFKFQSPLYRQVASMFFKEVASRMVGSFSERCRLIYGPGVPVLENTYQQGL